jgi:predicted nuclease with TOPRIM domain
MNKLVILLAFVSAFLLAAVVMQLGENASLSRVYQNYKAEATAEMDRLDAEVSRLTAEKQALSESQSKLNATYAKLLSDYRALNTSLSKLRSDYESLNDSYSRLSTEYSGLNTSYLTLRVETEKVLGKVDDYEKNLQDSMSWFRANSNLSGINDRLKEEQVQYNLHDNCYRIEGGMCRIKTGCLWVVNEHYLGLSYRTDIETTHTNDTLLSLQDFVRNRGGDCEDYSLFYKAEMNYIVGKCTEGGIPQSSIALEGFKPGGSEDYFLDFKTEYETRYYLPRTLPAVLKNGYIYPVEVCGSIYDLNQDNVTGHCIIAFTRNRITSVDEVHTELNLAPMIEPQTGEYMGLVNDASSRIYLASDSAMGEKDSYIYMLVTDGDLMLFDEEKRAWVDYSGFSKELAELEVRLTAMLG